MEFVTTGENFPNKQIFEDEREKAISVFDDIDMTYLRTHYLNKGYMSLNFAQQMKKVHPVQLKFNGKSIVFWEDYFMRYTPRWFQV